MQVRAQQNDTLDLLCWRYLGQTADIVEAALELNPGIAALGPILPHGHIVTLPDQVSAPSKQNQTVQLWD